MILYLDIDGVLNSNTEQSIKRRYGNYDEPYQTFLKLRDKLEKNSNLVIDKYHSHLTQMDVRLCLRFEEAVSKMAEHYDNFEIVICSTWRKLFNVDEFKYLFTLKGFPSIGKYITRLIQAPHEVANRGDEFKEKLKGRKCVIPGEKIREADAEILHDLIIHDVKECDYYILSDDVNALYNNLYIMF